MAPPKKPQLILVEAGVVTREHSADLGSLPHPPSRAVERLRPRLGRWGSAGHDFSSCYAT